MAVYIALLRGINVGGNNKIKMAELKIMLESMGLARVQTYIQSGNVLFESEEGADGLRQAIEREIKTAFGMSVSVILRTAAELGQVIANCPYHADELPEGHSIQICLLGEVPDADKIAVLSDGTDGVDEFRLIGFGNLLAVPSTNAGLEARQQFAEAEDAVDNPQLEHDHQT